MTPRDAARQDPLDAIPDEPMPLHKPVRWTIECSCGWRGRPDRFEGHRRKHEPEDVGRWVADGILDSVRRQLGDPR